MQFAERRRVRGEGMDFSPDFPASSPSLGSAGSLGVSWASEKKNKNQQKQPTLPFFLFLFFFFFVLFCFSLYFQEKPHVPTGRVGRSRFAFVPPLWDLARRGLAVGSGCVKLSSLSPRRKTPRVQHPVSARAGDGRG